MDIFLVLPVALGLAMDAFAVSLGVSLAARGLSRTQALRLSGSFGVFQLLMPLIGWSVGQSLVGLIRDVDHWVAFGLLSVVGGKMIVEALTRRRVGSGAASDSTKGGRLFLLSVATSIDAFAVGLGFAALGLAMLAPAVIIGAVAFGMSLLGCSIGPYLGRVAGKGAELLGGAILILIAFRILFEHIRPV